jgi:hypothetical protein
MARVANQPFAMGKAPPPPPPPPLPPPVPDSKVVPIVIEKAFNQNNAKLTQKFKSKS